MEGFCHLTDYDHYHHRQKPTMVGICHGGNKLGNHDDRGELRTFGWRLSMMKMMMMMIIDDDDD